MVDVMEFGRIARGLGSGERRRSDLPRMDYVESRNIGYEAMLTEDAVCWWCGGDTSLGRFVGDHICPVLEDPPIVAAHEHCNTIRVGKMPPEDKAGRMLHPKGDVIVSNMSAAERVAWLRNASEIIFGHPRNVYACIGMTRKKSKLRVLHNGNWVLHDLVNDALRERGWL